MSFVEQKIYCHNKSCSINNSCLLYLQLCTWTYKQFNEIQDNIKLENVKQKNITQEKVKQTNLEQVNVKQDQATQDKVKHPT